ncbi:hypothetical protein BH20ACT2_BH20ACT2_13240 [soil metagenome]
MQVSAISRPAPHRRRPRLRAFPGVPLPALLATAALLVTLVVLGGTGSIGPAAAEPVQAPTPAADEPVPVLSPDLADVQVSSAEHRASTTRRDAVRSDLAAATRIKEVASAELVALEAKDAELTVELDDAAARRDALARQVTVIRDGMRELAVAGYISGQRGIDQLQSLLDASTADEGRERVLMQSVSRSQVDDLARMQKELDGARRTLTLRRAVRDDVRDRLVATTTKRDAANTAEARNSIALLDAQEAWERTRALATVSSTDFPLVALDAYHRAAVRLAGEQPACGLSWWGLAGISKIEGRHGTFGGSELTTTGATTKPIIGIALDGTRNTARITDTDRGGLDGDATFDRAVGPMQFIPSTWARVARDGDGDGVADPHNLYDATLSAGVYLCRSSGGLSDDAGLRTAYFSYNHSTAYVDRVLSWSRLYQRSVAFGGGQ